MVVIGGFRIGVSAMPHQTDKLSLLQDARLMDVDVFVHGGDLNFSVFEDAGCLFVNPGSATGAMDSIPSFALLDIQSDEIVCYSYQLIDQQVKVEKAEFKKKSQ